MKLRSKYRVACVLVAIFGVLGCCLLAVNTSKPAAAFLNAGCSNAALAATEEPPVTIRLTFAQGEAIAVLYNHPASRDFAAMLPLTLTFQDFQGTEKIAYPPRKVATAQAPFGLSPVTGDLALFVPWGNIAIYYRDFQYSQDLVPLGRLQSGVEQVAQLPPDATVHVELVRP